MRLSLSPLLLVVTLAAACGGQTAGISSDAGADASSPGAGSTACDMLAACCNHVDDPSSCTETAQSGQITQAMCQSELDSYASQGICGLDGG